MGRNFIGFELDENYFEIANEKIAETEQNIQLNNCWVSFYLNNVVTIRDKDWEQIQECYLLPKNLKEIDHTPIQLLNNKKQYQKMEFTLFKNLQN